MRQGHLRSYSALYAGLICLAAGAFTFWRTFYGLDWINVNLIFDRTFRILQGQVPYRDFFCPTTPWMYYSLAFWMRLFGNFHIVSQFYAAAQSMLAVALTFFFCWRLAGLKPWACLLIAAMQAIWSPQMMLGSMAYDGEVTLYVLLAGVLLALARHRLRPAWACLLCAAACSFAFWTKQDIGAGAVAGGIAAAFLISFLSRKEDAKACLPAYLLGVLCVFACFGLYFWSKGAFSDMVYWIGRRGILFKWGAQPTTSTTIAKIFSPFTTRIDRSSKIAVLIYLLAPVSAWRRFSARQDEDELTFLGISLLWLCSFYAGLFTHNGQGYTTMVATLGCTFAILGRDALSDKARSESSARIPALAFVIALLLVSARGIKYLPDAIGTQREYVLQSPPLRGLHARAQDVVFDRLYSYIEKNVPPDQTFLFLDDYLALHFATRRLAPHPISNFIPGSLLPEDEPAVLASLNKHDVRWFFNLGSPEDLGKNHILAELPGLRIYIENRFKAMETRDGFTAWVKPK